MKIILTPNFLRSRYQEYINKECATPIWVVNTALAIDDVKSRSRLVVNIVRCSMGAKTAEASPLLLRSTLL